MSETELGVTCVGVFVGYLCMFYVARSKNHTVRQFVATIAALLTGTVASFLVTNIGDNDEYPTTIWRYPIGLVIGLVLWMFAKRTGLPATVTGVQQ